MLRKTRKRKKRKASNDLTELNARTFQTQLDQLAGILCYEASEKAIKNCQNLLSWLRIFIC
jgi:hypothetical protein